MNKHITRQGGLVLVYTMLIVFILLILTLLIFSTLTVGTLEISALNDSIVARSAALSGIDFCAWVKLKGSAASDAVPMTMLNGASLTYSSSCSRPSYSLPVRITAKFNSAALVVIASQFL